MEMSNMNFGNKKIILLCNQGESSKIVYNYLAAKYNFEKVIIEASVSKSTLIKRRIKKLGLIHVIGQLIFQIVICRFLKKAGTERINHIKQEHHLDSNDIPANARVDVSSVNSDQTLNLLQAINPDVIVVNGTRIISKRILTCCNPVFINMHAGITPRYRGTHGGYWALVENNLANCGVTIHLVDPGIDTGAIISQATFKPTSASNFTTYPYMQLAKGLPLLEKAIDDALHETLTLTQRDDLTSKLWYHPTAWGYLWNRFFGAKIK